MEENKIKEIIEDIMKGTQSSIKENIDDIDICRFEHNYCAGFLSAAWTFNLLTNKEYEKYKEELSSFYRNTKEEKGLL